MRKKYGYLLLLAILFMTVDLLSWNAMTAEPVELIPYLHFEEKYSADHSPIERTYVVVPGDRPTIQAAIDAAQSGSIVLVADGLYRGPGNRDLDFRGKAITVQSVNGAGSTIIDCEKQGRGFYFHSGETSKSVVRGFTIVNGSATDGYGGGIHCIDSSSPTIEDNIITGNRAKSNGGGIYCYRKSAPIIRNNEISTNSTDGSGGGIYCASNSSPVIQGNIISENKADKYGGGIYCHDGSSPDIKGNTVNGNEVGIFGGGISCENSSSPVIHNNIIDSNSADTYGGGIFCFSDSSPSIQDNIISGNEASRAGGGISCQRESSPTIKNNLILKNRSGKDGGGISCQSISTATIQANKINENTAGNNGAGIYSDSSSSASVENSEITGNVAGDYGGGIYCASSITVVNNTFSGNKARGGFGGSLYCFDGTPVVINTIFWGNTPKGIYVVETAGINVTYSDVEGGWPGQGNIDADPMFVSAATGNYHLSARSPCIGAGTTGGKVPSRDLEGEPREAPPDMGAYEDKPEEPVPIRGDVNKDGKVRANDAILTLQIVAGMTNPTDYHKWAADINGDGRIRSNDAILILRKAAGVAAPGNPAREQGESALSLITVSLDESHGIAGEEVTIPLRVDNTDGLAGGQIFIAYDPEALCPVDVSFDSTLLLVNNMAEPGIVRIAFANTGELSSDTLARIRLNILADDVSALNLKSVELYGPDALPLMSRTVDGRFSSWAMPPENSALLQNFPNPFNPETWIPYQLSENSEVAVCIYSAAGSLIRELNLGYRSAGLYVSRDRAAYWDGRNALGEEVTSGVYFYSIRAGGFSSVRKLTILK